MKAYVMFIWILVVLGYATPSQILAKNCDSDQIDYPSSEQVAVISQVMATREHRLGHYLWHGLRDGWFGLTVEEQEELKRTLPPNAIPPRPVNHRNSEAHRDDNSGEDFFYMHHQMINHLNHALHAAGLCPVRGWHLMPEKDHADYPLDPENPFQDESLFRNMKLLAWGFMSEDYLKTVTLGQLGHDIENSIHGYMHMRWTVSDGFPQRPEIKLDGSIDDPNWIHDDPKYQLLADPYSAHVNPIFWKLHGWIDDRIGEWLRVNGYTKIAVNCQDADGCYEWKGTWVGRELGYSQTYDLLTGMNPRYKDAIGRKIHDAAAKSMRPRP